MQSIHRRTFVKTLAGLPLLVGSVTLAKRAVASLRRPSRFDVHAQRTVSAVIDRMLPGDDLPGALALGIDRRLAAMADIPPRQPLSELHHSLTAGVAWLDRKARSAGAADFLRLEPVQQEAILTAGLDSKGNDAAAIVWTLRDRAFALYYTHPAVMAAFAYAGPPQPRGFPDFRDAPT
jgi:hypothetical protein